MVKPAEDNPTEAKEGNDKQATKPETTNPETANPDTTTQEGKKPDEAELNSDLDDDDEGLGFQILDPLPGDHGDGKQSHNKEGKVRKSNSAKETPVQPKQNPEAEKTDA